MARWRKCNNGKRVADGCRNHGSCEWCDGSRLHSSRVRERAASVEDDASMAEIAREVDHEIICRDDYPDCEDDPERVLLAFQPLIGEALAIAMRDT